LLAKGTFLAFFFFFFFFLRCVIPLHAVTMSKWWNQLSSPVMKLNRKSLPSAPYHHSNCHDTYMFVFLCSSISKWEHTFQ
jgi:hypothetical protein